MPLKIDIQTNINDCELTIESCSQIISMLQETYKNIRKQMYNHFLSQKNLIRALVFAAILLALYLVSRDNFFIYMMPVSVVLSMITSIVSAEYLTSQSRKQIHEQIQHYIEKRNRLLKDQQLKV